MKYATLITRTNNNTDDIEFEFTEKSNTPRAFWLTINRRKNTVQYASNLANEVNIFAVAEALGFVIENEKLIPNCTNSSYKE